VAKTSKDIVSYYKPVTNYFKKYLLEIIYFWSQSINWIHFTVATWKYYIEVFFVKKFKKCGLLIRQRNTHHCIVPITFIAQYLKLRSWCIYYYSILFYITYLLLWLAWPFKTNNTVCKFVKSFEIKRIWKKCISFFGINSQASILRF